MSLTYKDAQHVREIVREELDHERRAERVAPSTFDDSTEELAALKQQLKVAREEIVDLKSGALTARMGLEINNLRVQFKAALTDACNQKNALDNYKRNTENARRNARLCAIEETVQHYENWCAERGWNHTGRPAAHSMRQLKDQVSPTDRCDACGGPCCIPPGLR